MARNNNNHNNKQPKKLAPFFFLFRKEGSTPLRQDKVNQAHGKSRTENIMLAKNRAEI